ncbi:hypothetical protein SAMN05444274_101549 [Mariniphaga anaerophila]|uniref:Conjugal transfer protein TraD n=1 Tax=Mariniphaga anaerophila TaxID=1484053 RepID=A0A1M4U2U6_9BACT|nr:hypothetical protein [Mariniphaga anaerophila]SHE50837.1 hypothetical protein SAMN05444274_101549 [Mariniphaga anaerophila]
MFEMLSIIVLLLLFRYFVKFDKQKRSCPAIEKRNNSITQRGNNIVGESRFVLSEKKTIPQTAPDGKLDIEVPLDYEEENELQEELEELGVLNQLGNDITFDAMMDAVKDVETEQPQKPMQSGKLFYENQDADWVEQLAASSDENGHRVSSLIDLHLAKLEQQNSDIKIDDSLESFDIGAFV